MLDDFEDAFNTFADSYISFGVFALAFGQCKLYVQGDVLASDVAEYLESNGVKADCWQLTDGVVVAVAGADEARARALLENWR